ncbi:hypothetical protein ACFV6F_38200, partial [Kitasatospora phosalacinea]
MDLTALLAYLKSLGTPLNLDAGDRNLPGPVRDLLASVPGRGLAVTPGATGLRLDGTVLTVAGRSPGTWSVTGQEEAVVTTEAVEVRCGADGRVTGTVTGRLPLAPGVPVPVTLTSLPPVRTVDGAEARGWRIGLAADAAGVAPADLLRFAGAGAEPPFSAPAGLDVLGRHLTVPAAGFGVTFYPNTPFEALLTFTADLPGAAWTPVPGVLSLDRLTLAGTVAGTGSSATVTGRFVLGGVPVELSAGLTDDAVLRAELRPSGAAAFPGLAAIAAWATGPGGPGAGPDVSAIGGSAPAVDAAIRRVAVRFDPAAGALHEAEALTVLTLGALRLDAAFRYPEGTVTGSLHEGRPVPLADVLAGFGLPSADLPAATLVTRADFSATPALGSYLADLSIDTTRSVGPLTIRNLFFSVERTTADGFTGALGGTVTLASGTLFDLTGRYAGSATGWEFTGVLAPGDTLELGRTAADLTAAGRAPATLPAGTGVHGVPAGLTLTAAAFRAVPATGALHLEAQAEGTVWQIRLGAATLALSSIAAVLDTPGGGVPPSGSVSGTLEFAGLRARTALALGGPTAPAVFTGTVTSADAPNLSIARLTDGICAPGTGARWQSTAPAALAPSAFTSAALYLNASTSQLLLHGRLAARGAVPACDAFVYLARDPRPGRSGPLHYAAALSLGSGFRFDSLLPTAWGVDDRLRVSAARLVISDLAGLTLAELGTATEPLLAALGAADTALSDLGEQALTLSTGAACVARIDFTRSGLFRHLLEIGRGPADPAVWLTAVIERTDPSRTVFTAELPEITIADTVRLRAASGPQGAPGPQGPRVTYRPALADRVEVAGSVELDGIFGRTHRFDATLTVDDTGLTTTLSRPAPITPAPVPDEIPEPFGLPGLRITDLAVDLAYRWAAPRADGAPAAPAGSSTLIRGTVRLGPAPRPKEPDHRLVCAARLVLRDGAPALFDVALAADWTLGAFLAQCFTGTAAAWPSGLVDLTLRPGSRISYYDPARDPARTLRAPDGTVPRDGFTIEALLRLTLVGTTDLHGLLTVLRDPLSGRYDRITASLLLEAPLDLGFMALAGPELLPGATAHTGGPVLTLETGPAAKAVLQTGVNFLGTAFAAVEVAVAPASDGGRVLTGTLRAAGGAGPAGRTTPWGDLQCGFRYTTHPDGRGEFAVDHWPGLDSAAELVDFPAAIRALADSGSASLCGPLTRLVAERAFTSAYTIKPAVSAAGGDLVLTLSVGCTLSLAGSGAEFLHLELPPFPVRIPAATRWPDLPAAVLDGVRHAAADFARALLADPAKTALFLALVVGGHAVEVATVLLCDGLVDS